MAIEDEYDMPRAFRRGVADDFAVRPDERGYGPAYDPSTDISSRNLEAFMAAGGVDPIYVPSWLKASGKDARGTTPYENIQLMPGTNYRLVDFTGKNDNTILASGRTPEELFRLQQIVTNQLAPQGGQANWRLEREGQNGWETIGGDLYNKPITGTLADIALPAALAAIPGLGAIGTGLAAAGGSALSSGIQGRSLEDTLLRAAITGGTAGLMAGTGADKAISNVFSGGGSKLGATAAELAAQKAAAEAAGEMVVTGVRSALLPGAISGLTSGALSTGINNLAPDTFQQALDQARLDNQFGPAPDPSEIVVTNTANTPPNAISGGLSGAANTAVSNIQTAAPDNEILVQNTTTRPGEISGGLGGAATSAVTTNSPDIQTAAPDAEITVTNTATTPPVMDGAIGGVTSTVIPPLAPSVADILPPPPPPPEKPVHRDPEGPSTTKALTAALKLLPLLGGLVGGATAGGSGGTGTGGAAGRLNPIFTSQLPPPRAGFGGGSYAPRDMSGVDWKRYGFGPEKSFFENIPASRAEYTAAMNAPRPPVGGDVGEVPVGRREVPVGRGEVPAARIAPHAAGALPAGQSDPTTAAILRLVPNATPAQIQTFLQSPEGQQFAQMYNTLGRPFAKGGSALAAKQSPMPKESFAVRGPGTGRSDEIPALLSDGEYVIDAETVALLGDGSSKAGAERLDSLRANVRKHKGQSLAKGEISANAKPPERYLSGGRVK